MFPDFSREEIFRYSRHLLLAEVGLNGQRKLKTSSALVIGSGGLGSPVALYLAAAGVGHIGIVDHDFVELSNLQRQVIHGTSMVYQQKVDSAQARLLDLNPCIQIDVYNESFKSENAIRIADPYDIVIDCSDNFPTRYLSNDLCVLTGKPNVYGAVSRFDGQVSVFDSRTGPCYRCLFPDPPPPGLVPTCVDAGVFNILPGTIGTIQATEAIKILLGIGSSLTGRLLLYNALDMSFEYVSLKKDPNCKGCGPHPGGWTKDTSSLRLFEYEDICGVPGNGHHEDSAGSAWDITAFELSHRLEVGERLFLLDVREPHELEISRMERACNIPLGELAGRLSELDPALDIVLFCRMGLRSRRALELLVSAGFTRVKNLRGGINAWARDVDLLLLQY